MLKHMSYRSESRNSISDILSDLDDSKVDDLLSSCNEKSFDGEYGGSLSQRELADRDITDLLSKPTMNRIILRRRSDLINNEKWNNSMSEERISEKVREMNSQENLVITNAKEIIEEVQLENSTHLLHKRKKDNTQKHNLSDLSVESDIASQVSENNQRKVTTTYEQHNDSSEKISTQKDYWKLDDLAPPDEPLEASSPSSNKTFIQDSQQHPKRKSSLADKKKQLINQAQLMASDYSVENVGRPRSHKKRPYQHSHTTTRTNSHQYHSTPSSLYLEPRGGLDPPRRYRSVDMYLKNHSPALANNISSSISLKSSSTLIVPRKKQYRGSSPNSYVGTMKMNDTLHRKDQFRQSKHSISAGSSISNIQPNTSARSQCSCGTMGRSNAGAGLDCINEEMEHENSIFVVSEDKYNRRVQKCKCVAIFFIVLAALSCLVGGFLHYYVGHFPKNIVLNQGDVQLITLSSMFCNGVQAQSNTSSVRLITFNEDDEKKETMHYSRSMQFKLYPLDMWKREFYLLEGSEVTIFIQTNYLVDIMVFKGEKSFSLWSKRKESESYVTKTLCCSNKLLKEDKISFTAKSTDRYYFVVYNRYEVIPVDFKKVELYFKRAYYGFTQYASSCKADVGKSCVASFSFNSGDMVAIEIPLEQNTNKISLSSSLRYACVARIWFYCIFFIGIFVAFFVFVLVLSYIVTRCCIPSEKCCCYKNDKRQGKFDVIYYDNYGRTNSEIAFINDDYFDSVSHTAHSVAPSRGSELKSIYGDEMSETSKYIGHVYRQSSKASTLLTSRSIRHNVRDHTNDIAGIYSEEQINENADSGISMNAEVNNNKLPISARYKNSNMHEMKTMQEQQYHKPHVARQQYMRQASRDLVEAPRIKNLINNRPPSITLSLSEHVLNESNNTPRTSRSDVGKRLSKERPLETYSNDINIKSSNEENIELTKNIEYDNREIFI